MIKKKQPSYHDLTPYLLCVKYNPLATIKRVCCHRWLSETDRWSVASLEFLLEGTIHR